MEKKFYIHDTKYVAQDLYSSIGYYNGIVEDERIWEGHDDEPEDETRYL
jgi:hypothetical protein